MDSLKLREDFLSFFEENGHKIVASSSLIPEDKTVLLTSAGMQQFVPYLSGEKDILSDFKSRHLASVQKCFRTPDIEEVGDDTHHTFFEMLGNWSIGEDKDKGYFKEGAIDLAFRFFVDRLFLDKDRIWITIFKGEQGIPKDEESSLIWQKKGIPEERILEFGWKDNFWGPTSKVGPCGPSSEIHYDRGEEFGCKKPSCSVGCDDCRRFVELWNLVFMEYNKNEDGSYTKLPQRNVDTGIGFERLISLLTKKESAYETDLFMPLIRKIEELSLKKYKENKIFFRVISDHVRGAVFLITDGVLPSNIERGYILRRIIRRAIRFGKIIDMPKNFLSLLAKEVIENYKGFYPETEKNKSNVLNVIKEEGEKFEKTLESGLKELHKIIEWFDDEKTVPEANLSIGEIKDSDDPIKKCKELGRKLFFLYQSFGFPIEQSLEEFKNFNVKIIFKKEVEDAFKEQFKDHQEISRAGAEKKFGGVGDRDDYRAVKYHTATHLLHRALYEVLGKNVKQMGSDITKERLRFDFSHSLKMTKEEIKKVEDIVNRKIKEKLEVRKEEISYDEAIKSGAFAYFKDKYGEKVTVYSIGDFSKEVCGGPHVKNTSELSDFKIIKEESAGFGIRRIRAVLSDS